MGRDITTPRRPIIPKRSNNRVMKQTLDKSHRTDETITVGHAGPSNFKVDRGAGTNLHNTRKFDEHADE